MARVLDLLEHRGPDDTGWLSWDGDTTCYGRRDELRTAAVRVAFLHRRLSIIDLSNGGWQPMLSADGQVAVVFNGEIYNFVELRAELQGLGHRFHTRSDTEVLLAAYGAWGTGALPRLTGMFAFAILDTAHKVVILGRDYFGIKPLYYTVTGEQLHFASEIPALLELDRRDRKPHPERLYYYLRYGITDHGGDSLLAGVHQVPAGHYLTVDLRTWAVSGPAPYWLPDRDRRERLTLSEAAARFRELFLQSVALHLRSDVPVGTALSGGIDSSAIVACMRRHGGSELDLHAFSFVTDQSGLGEERWIDRAGAASGAVVHKVEVNPEELRRDVDHLIAAQGEPFGGTSVYAQFRVFQRARECGVKVLLDGQGADEMLGGYRVFVAARLASLVRAGRLPEAWRLLSAGGRLPGTGWLWLTLRVANFLTPQGRHARGRQLLRRTLMPSWLNARWFATHGVEPDSLAYTQRPDVLREQLWLMLSERMLPHLLRYEDRNSMAWSVESRVPFLTRDLVQFALALPEEFIIGPQGLSKLVFREAMRGIVPAEILARRDKIAFATPETRWMIALAPWVDEVLQSDIARTFSAFRLERVDRYWRGVRAGRRALDAKLWRCLNAIQWARHFGVDAEFLS